MDGAQASHLYILRRRDCLKLRRVGGREGGGAAFGASLGETASCADLGASSKYSNENGFEDRVGERFHMNGSWTWYQSALSSDQPLTVPFAHISIMEAFAQN